MVSIVRGIRSWWVTIRRVELWHLPSWDLDLLRSEFDRIELNRHQKLEVVQALVLLRQVLMEKLRLNVFRIGTWAAIVVASLGVAFAFIQINQVAAGLANPWLALWGPVLGFFALVHLCRARRIEIEQETSGTVVRLIALGLEESDARALVEVAFPSAFFYESEDISLKPKDEQPSVFERWARFRDNPGSLGSWFRWTAAIGLWLIFWSVYIEVLDKGIRQLSGMGL